MRCPYAHPSSLPVLRVDTQLPSASLCSEGCFVCSTWQKDWCTRCSPSIPIVGCVNGNDRISSVSAPGRLVRKTNLRWSPRVASGNTAPVYRLDVCFLSIATTTTKHAMPRQPSMLQKSIATSTKKKRSSFDSSGVCPHVLAVLSSSMTGPPGHHAVNTSGQARRSSDPDLVSTP